MLEALIGLPAKDEQTARLQVSVSLFYRNGNRYNRSAEGTFVKKEKTGNQTYPINIAVAMLAGLLHNVAKTLQSWGPHPYSNSLPIHTLYSPPIYPPSSNPFYP